MYASVDNTYKTYNLSINKGQKLWYKPGLAPHREISIKIVCHKSNVFETCLSYGSTVY